MTEVVLHGVLADKLGRSVWRLELETPLEAIRAIEATSGGMLEALRETAEVPYAIKINHVPVKAEEELFGVFADEQLRRVDILPVPGGAGGSGGWLILAGIVLIALSFIPIIGPIIAPYTIPLGISLILSGIVSLIAPTPNQPDDPGSSESKASYLFSGAVNTRKQGGPVPVGFGLSEIGSQTISFGLEALDVDSTEVNRFVDVTSDGGPAVCNFASILADTAGDTFDCYDLGTVTTLTSGNGWVNGQAWQAYHQGVGLTCSDPFSDYRPGYVYDALNGGDNWAGPWQVWDGAAGIMASDDIEAYALASPAPVNLNLGTGWSTRWLRYEQVIGLTAQDSFSAYSLATGITGAVLVSGTGWATGWADYSPPYAAALCAISGEGVDTVSDTFDCYLLTQAMSNLGGGSITGWSGKWLHNTNSALSSFFTDLFETYVLGDVDGQVLNESMSDWGGAWLHNTNSAFSSFFTDLFETYVLGDANTQILNESPADWSGPWVLVDTTFTLDSFDTYADTSNMDAGSYWFAASSWVAVTV